jgi:hypothetical protein
MTTDKTLSDLQTALSENLRLRRQLARIGSAEVVGTAHAIASVALAPSQRGLCGAALIPTHILRSLGLDAEGPTYPESMPISLRLNGYLQTTRRIFSRMLLSAMAHREMSTGSESFDLLNAECDKFQTVLEVLQDVASIVEGGLPFCGVEEDAAPLDYPFDRAPFRDCGDYPNSILWQEVDEA